MEHCLAFCIFSKTLHLADTRGLNKSVSVQSEKDIFDVLESSDINFSDLGKVVTTGGPGPFTLLRILRATQQGIATGIRSAAPLINTFDVLQKSAEKTLDTFSMFLETRRGDYFFRQIKNKAIVGEGISKQTSTPTLPVISDDQALRTYKVETNLAQTILDNMDLATMSTLDYGISPQFQGLRV